MKWIVVFFFCAALQVRTDSILYFRNKEWRILVFTELGKFWTIFRCAQFHRMAVDLINICMGTLKRLKSIFFGLFSEILRIARIFGFRCFKEMRSSLQTFQSRTLDREPRSKMSCYSEKRPNLTDFNLRILPVPKYLCDERQQELLPCTFMAIGEDSPVVQNIYPFFIFFSIKSQLKIQLRKSRDVK